MRLPLHLAAAFLLVAAECALVRPFGFAVVRPDLHVASIVFLALRFPTMQGVIGAALVGFWVDALSGQPTGLYAFASVIAYLVARVAAPFFTAATPLTYVPLVGVAVLVHNLIVTGSTLLTFHGDDQARRLLDALPWSALVAMGGAALAWVVFVLLDRPFKKQETGIYF